MLASLAITCYAQSNPIVDLGYGLWQATYNVTGDYYNFSNIRYAQPPVGNLRFAAPQEPLVNRSVVNDGQDGRICPQGFPSWQQERNLFTKQYLSDPNNITAFASKSPPGSNVSITSVPRDGRTSEDCLFLEVIVPRAIYEKGAIAAAPVFVWTYGGGYYSGDFESQGNPAGLVTRSMSNPQSSPGIVYVAFNYRLGALGWTAGPTFNASGGTANAGFYDQRLALEWVQKYISKFGGCPQRVTSAGESAGASMNLHQITAFGNSTNVPYQQAFLSSPAFSPDPYTAEQNLIYQRLLNSSNATSLVELRRLSSEQAIAANELAIFQAPYGTSGFGPVVDSVFAPQLPDILLAEGHYAKNIETMVVGHNTDEGLLFADPAIQSPGTFEEYVNGTLLPAITPANLDKLLDLYPAIFNNAAALGYNNNISRLSTLVGDYLIDCNANALAKAYPNTTRAFLFAEGAGLHGADTDYIFYNGGPVEGDFGLGQVNASVAYAMQDWILNFVATGTPNAAGSPSLPIYEPNRTMAFVSEERLGSYTTDPSQQDRCDFWQQALHLPDAST